MSKSRRLHRILRETAAHHPEVVTVFWDQMGYTRWPEPGLDWGPSTPSPPPQADRQQSPSGLWRVIGAMNAINGRVHFLDNDIVGRQQVLRMDELLNRSYRQARRIYVVQALLHYVGLLGDGKLARQLRPP